MRVVFDAYWWVEGPLSNRMVQRQFILTWLRDYSEDQVIALVPAPHLQAARSEIGPRAKVISTPVRPHAAAATAVLPFVARREQADVIVCHNFTPLAGRSVTFIHDVLFQTHPEWFTLPERAYLAPIPLLARRAAALATSSSHEASRIRAANRGLPVPTAVGLGIDPELCDSGPSRPARLRPVTEFVLTVGRLNVRKNLMRTIDGALRSGQVSRHRPLVIVGEPEGRGAKLDGRAETARRDGSLIFLDRVTNAELAWLYSETTLFCYLSLDEGYGLPPHEARYFGASVLVSDIPVFRETMAGRAEFVDPSDTAAIAQAFGRALSANAGVSAERETDRFQEDWHQCTARLRQVAEQVATVR